MDVQMPASLAKGYLDAVKATSPVATELPAAQSFEVAFDLSDVAGAEVAYIPDG
jgi:hypothetical protein